MQKRNNQKGNGRQTWNGNRGQKGDSVAATKTGGKKRRPCKRKRKETKKGGDKLSGGAKTRSRKVGDGGVIEGGKTT